MRKNMTYICNFPVPVSWRMQYCGVFEAHLNGVIYYFLDNEYYFKRDNLYGYYDDAERFAFFSRVLRRRSNFSIAASARSTISGAEFFSVAPGSGFAAFFSAAFLTVLYSASIFAVSVALPSAAFSLASYIESIYSNSDSIS